MNELLDVIDAINYGRDLDDNYETEALEGFELETITFEEYN